MGVYIKGMEMPKNCRACRLKMNCDDCEGFECVCLPLHTQIGYLNDLLTDKRRDDCPLAPVPEPHGRLGDLDKLEKMFADIDSAPYSCFDGAEPFYSAEDAVQIIRLAPTIIPSSEEE